MRNIASILLVLSSLLALALSYSTSGNRILDPNGKPILLRGVARPSLEWNVNGESLSLSDYTKMKAWGANVVRIGLNQGFWLSGSKEYNPNYVGTVDQQVQWVKSLGMGIILDLHWSDEGNTNNYGGQRVMADTRSLLFWNSVATKYKNDPWVIFELYNEPHDVPDAIWRDGGVSAGFQVVGMQQLYNEVRKTGANNVVIVNGLNYAFDLRVVANYPLTGSNIVYGTHPYDFGGKQPSDWDAAFGYLSNTYPLIATEFGEFNCNPNYNNLFVAYANQKSISWTAWAWYPQGCAFPSAILNWNGDVSATAVNIKNSLLQDSKVPNGGTSTTKSATSSSATTASATTTTTTTGSATTGGSSTAVNVFTDSIQSSFVDYSWNSKIDTLLVSSPVQSGSKAIQYTPSSYNAIYFYRSGFIDTSVHSAIEFYIHGGSTGNQQINFNVVRLSGTNSVKYGPDQRVATYTTTSTIPAGSWVKGTVSLSNFPAGTYDGLWFQDQSGGTQSAVYIDSVRILNK